VVEVMEVRAHQVLVVMMGRIAVDGIGQIHNRPQMTLDKHIF